VRNDRKRIIALSFVLLSIGSAVYISAASLNYLGLYPALAEVQVQLTKVTFLQNPNNISQSTLNTFVNVSNPAGYSGLRVGPRISLTIFLYVETNRSITLFGPPNTIIVTPTISAPLPSDSVYSAIIPAELTPQQTNQTVSFINHHMNDVGVEVTYTVNILTFLESVTGAVIYTDTRDIPLSSS
jgi:hypothetical protein